MRITRHLFVSFCTGITVSVMACGTDVADDTAPPDEGDASIRVDGATAADTGNGPDSGADDASANDAASNDAASNDAAADAQPVNCTNGNKDGDETDTDCGGSCGTKCADGKACALGARDCTSGVCTGAVCQVPSPTDGVKNGTETDTDCGGPGATTARCLVGKTCGAASDCFQRFCEANVCAEPPSCRTNGDGKNTCGPTSNESCCTTLAVPGGTYKQLDNASYTVTVSPYKLDKYEISQGRLRAFYAAYGGNLRGTPPAAGAGANPHVANSGWQSAWNDRLPQNMTEVNDRLATDNGCFGASDAHTWTAAASANDAKAVNCADWYTLAAFCIWDGGRLPTEAEWGFAAEGGNEQRKFAWGNAPDASTNIPVGSDPNTYGNQAGLYVVHGFCNSSGPSCFSYGTTVRLDNDGPAHIAPPGRKLDIARWGHHDMSGNLIEWTLDTGDGSNPCAGTNCARVNWPDYHVDRKDPLSNDILGDRSVGGLPSYWRNYSYDPSTSHDLDGRYHLDGGRTMRGGSWEVAHPVSVRTRFGAYPVWRAYYAAGARCARD